MVKTVANPRNDGGVEIYRPLLILMHHAPLPQIPPQLPMHVAKDHQGDRDTLATRHV
ncbi:MAG: hypothetical protein Q6K14_09180 [Gloeomargarita sp. GMQP_bins_44]